MEAGLLAPLVGVFIDRFGARRVVLLGVAIIGASFLLLSSIDSLYFFYGTFLLMAIGNDCALGTAQYVAVANWFSKRRGLALGVLSSGYGAAGVMGVVLVLLINS